MLQPIHRNRIQMRRLPAADMPEPLPEKEMVSEREMAEDRHFRQACRML
jgi:hypothetical protein